MRRPTHCIRTYSSRVASGGRRRSTPVAVYTDCRLDSPSLPTNNGSESQFPPSHSSTQIPLRRSFRVAEEVWSIGELASIIINHLILQLTAITEVMGVAAVESSWPRSRRRRPVDSVETPSHRLAYDDKDGVKLLYSSRRSDVENMHNNIPLLAGRRVSTKHRR